MPSKIYGQDDGQTAAANKLASTPVGQLHSHLNSLDAGVVGSGAGRSDLNHQSTPFQRPTETSEQMTYAVFMRRLWNHQCLEPKQRSC